MTNISKKRLSDQQLEKLFSQLSVLVAKSSTANAKLILSDLLGYEEKVMLAKRLAAVLLLHRGTSLYQTAQLLKISTATATKIHRQIEVGEYEHIVNVFKKKSHYIVEVIGTIDSILHLGGILPHYSGPDRRRGIG